LPAQKYILIRPEDAAQTHRWIQRETDEYLREMGVPQKYLELMMSTRSGDIRWLREDGDHVVRKMQVPQTGGAPGERSCRRAKDPLKDERLIVEHRTPHRGSLTNSAAWRDAGVSPKRSQPSAWFI
jgi:hypothetical protein